MPNADGAGAAVLPESLERLALRALEAPELCAPPLPSGFTTVARLWVYEGQGAWRAWAISSRPSAIDAPALRVRRIVWDRPGERARLAGLTPADLEALSPLLYLQETRYPPESWSALLEEAAGLRMPPLPPEDPAPGGAEDRFGLEYRAAAQTVSFEWWGPPPAAWAELAGWGEKTRAALDAWLRP